MASIVKGGKVANLGLPAAGTASPGPVCRAPLAVTDWQTECGCNLWLLEPLRCQRAPLPRHPLPPKLPTKIQSHNSSKQSSNGTMIFFLERDLEFVQSGEKQGMVNTWIVTIFTKIL